MASPVIKIKRSSVQNNAPTAAQLELGELALNTYDGKLFTEINDGTVSVVEIGGHLQHLAVSGISTFTGNIDANGNLDVDGTANLDDVDIDGNLDVDGQTDLDVLNVSDTATFTGDLKIDNINKSLQIGAVSSDNYVDIRQISASSYHGLTFQHSNASVFQNLQGSTNQYLVLGDNDNGNSGSIFGIVQTQGGSTYNYLTLSAAGNLNISNNITLGGTVDGRDVATDGTKLDTIESNATADQTASEILTLLKTVDGAGSGLDADTLDGVSSGSFVRSDATDTVSGALTFTNDATFTGDVYLTDAGTDSSAGPILDFYRNSSSAADADYMGQIKFQGENDADQKLVYAKITGKIQDASDGTEDGLIEFANKKAGSNVITARLRSDSFQLLNSTNFSVAGDSTLTGGLDVDGHTEVDNLKSVGIATFSNNAIHANVYSTGISTISGFRFPTADGDEDQALVTDGNGQLSFKTLSGGGGGATGAATTISAGIQTATQGQTAFSTPHPHNDGTTTYSTQVFVNGLKFRPQGAGSSKDYTTSSNSTITMEEGLNVGDEVVSVVYFGHTIDEEYFTATQGQVLFPLSGSLSAQKNFRVFVNGTKLRNGDDYGVAAPVTLVVPCAEGAEVEIVCDNAEDKFIATDQQTNFTPTSTDISTSNMQVYVNGLQLFKGIDFSIGSPSVTLTDAAGLTVGDEVDVCIRRTA